MDGFKNFKAQAVIFDKDGTLIDFDVMWGGWVVYLAGQLNAASGLNVEEPFYVAMGYDHEHRKVLAGGRLASRPMAQLRHLTIEVMQSFGLNMDQAEQIVEQAWCIPDPVILAKPLTDIRTLFSQFHSQKIKIGIATADDRAPTQAMIEAFDVEEFISTMACGDDGIKAKPAPDMVLAICKGMKIDPAGTMVIGDTVADLKMARAAGAGLVVGVLSGVSSARDLVSYADVLIESVDELHAYAHGLAGNISAQGSHNDLNPDFAF